MNYKRIGPKSSTSREQLIILSCLQNLCASEGLDFTVVVRVTHMQKLNKVVRFWIKFNFL